MFTEQEIKGFHERGISPETVKSQIAHFEKGFPFIQLEAPATVGDGILVVPEAETDRLVQLYDSESRDLFLIKFVPASGAASRMFSHLFALQDALNEPGADAKAILADEKNKLTREFFEQLPHFAFYDELRESLQQQGIDLQTNVNNNDYLAILNGLLSAQGLSYANMPKGLLSFHKYGPVARKAAEEHLVEGVLYGSNHHKQVHLHFTLSPEHIAPFEKLMHEVVPSYEKQFGITYHITHSLQDPATDIIAVDLDNKPFYDKEGQLVFRPGGHGALINNLNQLEADLIFIKNIDNIVPDRLKDATVRFKKLIGGMLLELREQIFQYLEDLDEANMEQSQLNKIRDFCTHRLLLRFPDQYRQFDMMEQIDYLYSRLNRPLRVCGMVKNEGEPGGGPFWVRDIDDEVSLQIVESSQVNMNDPRQAGIFKASTHFNPVDLVCSIRDYNGDKFDLQDFVDPETGFISTKTKDGRQLKAQELPGLWNGAMANWLTLFVEVPVATFNPVKTVNDLLRENHKNE